MADIEKQRADRETNPHLRIRRADDYSQTDGGSGLEFEVFVLADGPVTAQGVRVTALLDFQPLGEAGPLTILAGAEERFLVRIRDADQIALRHTQGSLTTFLARLWLRAQPMNGPEASWHPER